MSKVSKEYFTLKRGIDNIKRLRDLETRLGRVFYSFDKELNNKHFSLGSIEADQLAVLRMAFNDDHSESWISYFVYECNLGKTPLQVTLKNGRKITMKNVTNLWDVLKSDV